MHFTLDFNNISSQFGNNVLYLNDLGTLSIVLVNGCYDIDDLNNYNLSASISGLFYKITQRMDGQGYGLFSYTSSVNRSSNISGILINNTNGLNAEI